MPWRRFFSDFACTLLNCSLAFWKLIWIELCRGIYWCFLSLFSETSISEETIVLFRLFMFIISIWLMFDCTCNWQLFLWIWLRNSIRDLSVGDSSTSLGYKRMRGDFCILALAVCLSIWTCWKEFLSSQRIGVIGEMSGV